jgi:flagellar basal-body rod protein FlgG
MMDGMKQATQGMLSMSLKQDLIANNLANVSTAGFKKESIGFTSFTEVMNREMGITGAGPYQQTGYMEKVGGMDMEGQLYASSATHFSQGPLKETGDPFHMALDDNGRNFFVVKGADGEIRFTRNGSFKLDAQGYVRGGDGSYLMGVDASGQKVPIKVAEGKSFVVESDGTVKIDNKPAYKVLVAGVPDTKGLSKSGDAMFRYNGTDIKYGTDFRINQGYLEMSNVNVVKEMVEMMSVMRTFEANQKLLQTEDQMLRKAANETGKVR